MITNPAGVLVRFRGPDNLHFVLATDNQPYHATTPVYQPLGPGCAAPRVSLTAVSATPTFCVQWETSSARFCARSRKQAEGDEHHAPLIGHNSAISAQVAGCRLAPGQSSPGSALPPRAL